MVSAPKLDASQLADSMARVVESQKHLGSKSYPTTIGRVADVVEVPPGNKAFKAAIKIVAGNSFPQKLLVVGSASKPESLLLFQDDLPSACSQIVDAAYGTLSSDAKVTTAKLASGVPKSLRTDFKNLVIRDLGKRLAESLQSAGASALSVTEAAETLRMATSTADFKKVVAEAGLICFGPIKSDYAVLAKEERCESVVESDDWLSGTIDEQCEKKNAKRILTPGDCIRGVPANAKKRMVAALERRVADDRLPTSLAYIMEPKGPKIFRRQDVRPHSTATPQTSTPQPVEATQPSPVDEKRDNLDERFLATFDRLDRQRGGYNQVSLLDLRRELNDVPRGEFDQTLRQLRFGGKLSLAAAEGRNGISPEEQEAAVHEGGSLLLFVERRLD